MLDFTDLIADVQHVSASLIFMKSRGIFRVCEQHSDPGKSLSCIELFHVNNPVWISMVLSQISAQMTSECVMKTHAKFVCTIRKNYVDICLVCTTWRCLGLIDQLFMLLTHRERSLVAPSDLQTAILLRRLRWINIFISTIFSSESTSGLFHC